MDPNDEKKRAAYFTPIEQEILLTAYAENEYIFKRKSNTSAAAKERELAWQKIADQVNACNPSGVKRTWQQIKMKYKNIVQSANRKKAEARKTGGGPPPPPFTQAEELALSQNSGRPITDGIPGGSSTEPTTPQNMTAYVKVIGGVVQTTEPPAVDEETVSAVSDDDALARPMDNMTGDVQPDEGPSTSRAQLGTLPVKDLYKIHLQKQIEKCDLQMEHIKLQIKQTSL